MKGRVVYHFLAERGNLGWKFPYEKDI